MVRKSKHKRYSKIESDESDSDDFYEENNEEIPPKKYSLRRRKQANLDEHPDNETPTESIVTESTEYEEEKIKILKLETSPNTENSNGLIDFEDVIRADILVNKKRMDYENIIEKNEIKIDETVGNPPDSPKPVQKKLKTRKKDESVEKRGRKSKKLVEYQETSNESNNAGLPINSVLGVSESLYELAERYMADGQPTENGVVFPLQEAEPSEAIEIF